MNDILDDVLERTLCEVWPFNPHAQPRFGGAWSFLGEGSAVALARGRRIASGVAPHKAKAAPLRCRATSPTHEKSAEHYPHGEGGEQAQGGQPPGMAVVALGVIEVGFGAGDFLGLCGRHLVDCLCQAGQTA